MDILIIGNGFDRQHDLKTDYGDFLDYCLIIEHMHKEDTPKFASGVYTDEDKALFDELKGYTSAYENMVSFLESFWFEYFKAKRENIGNKWINFETEIEIVLKDILHDRELQRQKGIKDDRLTPETNRKYKEEFTYNRPATYGDFLKQLEVDLPKLTQALETYLNIIVETKLKTTSRQRFFERIPFERLISFNYTRTYLEVYNPMIEADYIHGKVTDINACQSNNIVLGFDDHYTNNEAVLESIPFEKYYQRIVKKTDCKYFEWFDEKDKEGNEIPKTVYFYGHSMSPADGDILKLIIMNTSVKTKIYYRKNHEEDRAEMIKNLAVVLSANELIKLTSGTQARIEFIPVPDSELVHGI